MLKWVFLLKFCLEKAFTEEGLEWRSFVSQFGRQGMKFYYPKYETIGKLEDIGTLADDIPVYYNGSEIPLIKAYEAYVKVFKEAIEADNVERFEPFIYASKPEYEWIMKVI